MTNWVRCTHVSNTMSRIPYERKYFIMNNTTVDVSSMYSCDDFDLLIHDINEIESCVESYNFMEYDGDALVQEANDGTYYPQWQEKHGVIKSIGRFISETFQKILIMLSKLNVKMTYKTVIRRYKTQFEEKGVPSQASEKEINDAIAFIEKSEKPMKELIDAWSDNIVIHKMISIIQEVLKVIKNENAELGKGNDINQEEEFAEFKPNTTISFDLFQKYFEKVFELFNTMKEYANCIQKYSYRMALDIGDKKPEDVDQDIFRSLKEMTMRFLIFTKSMVKRPLPWLKYLKNDYRKEAENVNEYYANNLLDSVDMIQESMNDSKISVLCSLMNTYVKSAFILENYNGDDISEFEIFQEVSKSEIMARERYKHNLLSSEGKKYRSNESGIKKILLFLPRLIYTVLIVITFLIAVLVSEISSIITGFYRNKSTKLSGDQNETIKLDFNIFELKLSILSFISIFNAIKYQGDTAVNTVESNIDAFTRGILSIRDGGKVYMDECEKYAYNFDKYVLKPRTCTRREFGMQLSDLKRLKPRLNSVMRRFSKYANSQDQITLEGLTDEDRKFIQNFYKMISSYGKNISKFTDKINDPKKKANNAPKASSVKSSYSDSKSKTSHTDSFDTFSSSFPESDLT